LVREPCKPVALLKYIKQPPECELMVDDGLHRGTALPVTVTEDKDDVTSVRQLLKQS
jgi:hypothetical protein